MKLKVKNERDDLFQNRLFAYLQKQFAFQLKEIRPIRKNVFLVKSNEYTFILKGFSTYRRLKLQEIFTSALKEEKFKTYLIYPFTNKEPLFFEGIYYGCIEYIEPSEKVFTFRKHNDRKEGLDTLSSFHTVTKKLVHDFNMVLPAFTQLEKWQQRTALFLNNISVIKYFVPEEVINEILLWADWALKGMKEEEHLFHKGKKVILHGDVAHHNFLRSKNKELYLIDFDLISIGIPYLDLLQYANRILPFLHWSLHEMTDYRQLIPLLHEQGFIYALAFPTDIFREWNRAIKDQTYLHSEKSGQLLEITAGQFKERQNFFMDLKHWLGQ